MKKFLALALLLCTVAPTAAQQLLDPCQLNVKSATPINQTASAGLFNGASARKNYICSIMIIGSDAENVSLVEGTGAVCATTPLALIGGTTAASGLALPANGGFALGAGTATVAAGAGTNANVCLLQSGTGRIGGVMTYVQQ